MSAFKMLRISHVDGFDICPWAPVPTEIEYRSIPTDAGTEEHLFTPPVASGQEAVRIHAWRRLDSTGKVISASWKQQRASGWHDYYKRTNWAGRVYGDGDFFSSEFRYDGEKSIPKNLYARFMADVFRFVHGHEPEELAERLGSYDNWLQNYKSDLAANEDAKRQCEDRYGRVEHGDIYLTERPINFQDGSTRQAFLALRKRGKGARIKSYVLPRQSALDGNFVIYPVTAHYGRMRRSEMFKLCQASLDDIGTNLTAHEKIELLALQQQIHANLDRIEVL
jgi:hypothetical protein